MYCLTNMCYVCFEKKDKTLININTSLSVNKDIIHVIGYLPFNLAWFKTMQTILICEECCLRLRETYQFLAMCLKNSSLLQDYVNKLHSATISNTDNEAKLYVDLNNKHNDLNKIKCEIKLEDEQIYTFETGPIFEETEDMFMNVDDSFAKEEDTWKSVVDDKEESPMDNNSIKTIDNELDTEISVNSKSKQVHRTNKKNLNTTAKKSHKCLTCSKSFSARGKLEIHTRIHTGEKPYKCSGCDKCFADKSNLSAHFRTHTGEKPYECSRCKKCFGQPSVLVRHMRIHTGVKPYKCTMCTKCFPHSTSLIRHIQTHTGEKPYQCSICKKCFSQHGNLVLHMRTHRRETE